MKELKTCAIILAAGSGKRMNLSVTKQQLEILGETVLFRTLEAFEKCKDVDSIIVVTRDDEIEFVKSVIADGITKVRDVVVGGAFRAVSAYNGFCAIPSDTDFVAIHDGARCLITPEQISRIISDAKEYGAATAATYLTDTIKEVDENGFTVRTHDRRFTVSVQTPQIFRVDIYKNAIENVDLNDPAITDDNMLIELLGGKVYCTDVGKENIKITYKSDIEYAEYILKGRGADV